MTMITFEQALKKILENVSVFEEEVAIENSSGMVSAEDIYSEISMPPFNKSAMDGYALIAENTKSAPVKLKCIGLIQAGEIFKRKVLAGECAKIMTGAALPKGADSVVMVEDAESSSEVITIKVSASKGQNICFKGEDIKKGSKVLEKNRVISSSCIALLAAIGRRFVKVIKRPEAAILNTGGELTPPGGKLSRGRIYNSNGPQLSALLKSDGISPRYLGIVKDEREELTRAVRRGLKSDIFLISGGVSMGDYDLVPGILARAGVRKIFHKVGIKPGKPLFFGRKAKTLVFGIPGNPVSNFLAYQLFIRPAVCKISGHASHRPKFEKGILTSPFRQKPGRTHFVLAAAEKKSGGWHVNPVVCHGSADVLALSKSDGFMVVDKNISRLRAGSKVKILLWK